MKPSSELFLGLIDRTVINAGGTIVADASSLVYLDRIGMLQAYGRHKNLLTTPLVFHEISRGSGDNGGHFSQVEIRSVAPSSRTGNERPRGKLSLADMSLVALQHRVCSQAVLTDDGALCRFCRMKGIAYINSPLALFTLLVNSLIDRDVFCSRLLELYNFGRYGRFVREFINDILNRWDEMSDNIYYVNQARLASKSSQESL